jgi:hypothetical protein
MVAAPTATRTWRMDLRTASRKAWLAFSIKCQRSATWGGVRERLGHSKGVTTAAVARDHSNLRLPRKPSLCSSWLSVG